MWNLAKSSQIKNYFADYCKIIHNWTTFWRISRQFSAALVRLFCEHLWWITRIFCKQLLCLICWQFVLLSCIYFRFCVCLNFMRCFGVQAILHFCEFLHFAIFTNISVYYLVIVNYTIYLKHLLSEWYQFALKEWMN